VAGVCGNQGRAKKFVNFWQFFAKNFAKILVKIGQKLTIFGQF
jgi:hypothetical protein